MDSASHNGIDILCDAVGAVGSSSGVPNPRTAEHLLSSLRPAPGDEHLQQPVSPSGSSVAMTREKRKLSETASPVSSAHYVCHICRRVYERADHLSRHLRSHENARPYGCSRCPKRFNRADLLTRHQATHDRDTVLGDKARPFIRRSDRAALACLNCAASKAKCEDRKPCGRCRSRGVPCEMPPRKAVVYRTVDDVPQLTDVSPAESSATGESGYLDTKLDLIPSVGDAGSFIDGPPIMTEGVWVDDIEAALGFNPMNELFQDMDFSSWNIDFDAFSIPHFDPTGPSMYSSSSSTTNNESARSHAGRDLSRGYAAFKRSPWLWEPEHKDYVLREKEGLALGEEEIANSTVLGRLPSGGSTIPRLKTSLATRDRLFTMVLDQHREKMRTPSFPSLDLLNYLLQAYIVQDDYQCDSFVHVPSFNPETSIAELVGNMIAKGATFIAVPAIWQFGYAMHEVCRISLITVIEEKNSTTRDLETLQCYIISLGVGQWSGFKRKMEIAEGFVQPLYTMFRRGSKLSHPVESLALMPSPTDTDEVLESKWRDFIRRESWKRLILHAFCHDVQSSVSRCSKSLFSYNELCLSLPASRDLWKAGSVREWSDTYLAKKAISPERTIPHVADVMHVVVMLDELEDHVDVELCYMTMLHGYWGQISSYRESVRFYQDRNVNASGGSVRQLWLEAQHKELYHDLSGLSAAVLSSKWATPQLAMFAEVFKMILHVSPEDLQNFAGKLGEEQARRAAVLLEKSWAGTSEARHAVWHAGQVFRHARRLPPTSLRDFNAIAVYFASLTLWVYGLLSCQSATRFQSDPKTGTPAYILVDWEESRDTRSFLQLDRGVPALTCGDARQGIESLSNPGMVLAIARNIYRENFPVQSEPLPTLVESLGNLLRDLGNGVSGRGSRAVSPENA